MILGECQGFTTREWEHGSKVRCAICKQQGRAFPFDRTWVWSQQSSDVVAHTACVEEHYHNVEGDF